MKITDGKETITISDDKGQEKLSVSVKGMTTKQKKQARRKLQLDWLSGKRDEGFEVVKTKTEASESTKKSKPAKKKVTKKKTSTEE